MESLLSISVKDFNLKLRKYNLESSVNIYKAYNVNHNCLVARLMAAPEKSIVLFEKLKSIISQCGGEKVTIWPGNALLIRKGEVIQEGRFYKGQQAKKELANLLQVLIAPSPTHKYPTRKKNSPLLEERKTVHSNCLPIVFNLHLFSLSALTIATESCKLVQKVINV